MNILTIGDKKFTLEIAKQLKDHNLYSIYGEKLNIDIKRYFSKIHKNITLIPHKKLKNYDFMAGIKWDKISPLDCRIADSMRHCESIVLKMLERIKSIKPHDSFDKRRTHYIYSMKYWNWFLDNYKIEALLTYSIPHMGYDYIVYELCRLKGIKVYINYFLFPDWGYFMDDIYEPFQDFKPENKRKKFLFPGLKKIFDEYLNNKPLSYKPVVIPQVKRVIKFQEKARIQHKPLLMHYTRLCKSPNMKVPFIYVPLHYQYEGSTCPLGSYFVDQFYMIEILSRLGLNAGLNIYVKEHPHLSKNRNIQFYNAIARLKNVSLISTETNNYTLINNCFCVATITGTAGWEAALKGKCTLLFGSIYYQYLPGVFKVKNVNDCLTAIEDIKKYKFDEKVIDRYLMGIENYLHPLTYKDIVKSFKKKIEGVIENVRTESSQPKEE